jgi:hypothetical protein
MTVLRKLSNANISGRCFCGSSRLLLRESLLKQVLIHLCIPCKPLTYWHEKEVKRKLEVLIFYGTFVNLDVVFWDIASCSPYVKRRFGGTYHLNFQGRNSAEKEASVQSAKHWFFVLSSFNPEEEGDKYVRNVGSLMDYTTLTNSVAWVREQTISTERPPLVSEVSANFCGERVPRGQRDGRRYIPEDGNIHNYRCENWAEWTKFHTHYLSETLVEPGIEPGHLDL